jgi:ribose 5-phosphate isomerase A
MDLSPTQQAALKQLVGAAAADLVQPGMRVGLGTGSTTAYFISALIDRVQRGLVVAVLPSSIASERIAVAGRLPLLDAEEVTFLDLYVDGADAVDPEGRLIKGGGGALLREKITAGMSKQFIVIVDESKHVPSLQGLQLPVEVMRFGAAATLHHLAILNCSPQWRLNASGSPVHTDNGNRICDVVIPEGGEKAERFADQLMSIPGVVGHGLFANMAQQIWTGTGHGEVRRHVL